MNYQQISVKDLFYIKKISSNKDRTLLRSACEKKKSPIYIMNNVGITITCAKQLSIGYSEGNNFTMQETYYLVESVSNSSVNVKYVYYFLLSNKDRLDKLYKTLNELAFIRAISRFMIFYPSVSEQYAIISKLDAIFNLIRITEESLRAIDALPYAVYRRNEQIMGALWKAVPICEITQQISIKKRENQISDKVKKSAASLIFGDKMKLVLHNISSKYNVEVLKCILSGKQFVKKLEQVKKGGTISLYKIKRTIIRIPSKKEQDLILRLYHKSTEVKDYLYDSVCSLYLLKKYYLHHYLYRKNFGQHIGEILHGDISKYSYLKPMMIGSINRYDELRKELYDSLKNKEVIQYFDALTKSVKLRKNEISES